MRNLLRSFLASIAEPVQSVQQSLPVELATTGPAVHLRAAEPLKGNGLLLQQTGLRVTHIRRLDGHDLTVAYRPRRSRSHLLEVSVANRNPEDVFSRRLGTQYAVGGFLANSTVRIPPLGELSDVELIQYSFGGGPFDISDEFE